MKAKQHIQTYNLKKIQNMTVWKKAKSKTSGKEVPVKKCIYTKLDRDVERYNEFREQHKHDFNLGHYKTPYEMEYGEWKPERKGGHWFF